MVKGRQTLYAVKAADMSIAPISDDGDGYTHAILIRRKSNSVKEIVWFTDEMADQLFLQLQKIRRDKANQSLGTHTQLPIKKLLNHR